MQTYTIMPLDTAHADEICADIVRQKNEGVAETALFMMTLVPEGDPPADKAGIYCESFDVFRDKLAKYGIKPGILVQASIGHGYPLDNMFPFRRVTGFTDGKEYNICCPADESFREHFRSVMRTLALRSPSVIMLDDDFRLMGGRPGRGCACSAHLAEFNRRAGTDFTREELLRHTAGTGDDDRRYTKIFIDTQIDSLVGAAKAMREGIDSVDPSLPGVFCACGNGCEGAAEIASALAGRGNPVTVRLNNGNYTPAGARGVSSFMYRAATQAAALRGRIDVLLAETDTCPQNRYSTGAQSLHTHYTCTILEGVAGAKHWITRLGAYEPKSGEAYRRILAKHSGFYAELARIVPTLEPVGCRIPLTRNAGFGFATSPEAPMTTGWAYCVLERLGLPMYFSEKSGGAVFMDGDDDARFNDAEIDEMFRGTVFLASDTAARLNERGFRAMTGADVREWNGRRTSGEYLPAEGNVCAAQVGTRELITDADAAADSTVFHIPDGKTHEPLFPGSTVFKNPAGGTTVVFAGTPRAQFNYIEAFSFLNESRKRQLVRLLASAGELPVYYPGDAELFLRAAKTPDGGLFCAAVNIGLDPIERLTLAFDREITRVESLEPDGTRAERGFIMRDGVCEIDVPTFPLNPTILFVK